MLGVSDDVAEELFAAVLTRCGTRDELVVAGEPFREPQSLGEAPVPQRPVEVAERVDQDLRARVDPRSVDMLGSRGVVDRPLPLGRYDVGDADLAQVRGARQVARPEQHRERSVDDAGLFTQRRIEGSDRVRDDDVPDHVEHVESLPTLATHPESRAGRGIERRQGVDRTGERREFVASGHPRRRLDPQHAVPGQGGVERGRHTELQALRIDGDVVVDHRAVHVGDADGDVAVVIRVPERPATTSSISSSAPITATLPVLRTK